MGMEADLGSGEMGAGGVVVQGHLQLFRQQEASLGYMRLNL